MRGVWIVLLAALFAAPPLPAETLVYSKKTGADLVTITVRIEPAGSGYEFTSVSVRDGKPISRVTMLMDGQRATREWAFWEAKGKIEVRAKRDGDRITITGSKQGKPVRITHEIDGRPWLQWFPFGWESFIVSGEKRFEYWSCHPAEFTCGLFTVAKTAEEKATVMGREEPAWRVRLSLSGPLSVFWGADLWLRSTDGRYLRYRGTSGPGTPESFTELTGAADENILPARRQTDGEK